MDQKEKYGFVKFCYEKTAAACLWKEAISQMISCENNLTLDLFWYQTSVSEHWYISGVWGPLKHGMNSIEG